MDLLKGIYVPILIFVFVCSGSYSSQLYLQPQQTQHGYFTNDSFFITCFTTDENIDQLRWSDSESKEINSTDGRIHIQFANGTQQGLRLVFTSVEEKDAGTYTCGDGQDSTSFELIVTRSISFGDTPNVQHAPEGEDGLLICDITSNVPPVVTWYFKGQQIRKSAKYQILENHSLRIYNLSRNDAGEYKCKALLITSLSTQMKDFHIKLDVQYRPEIVGEQRFNKYASIGTNVRLPCTVTADPDPMFLWLRDEKILYNGNEGYTIFDTSNSSILQFAFENAEQLGEYICRANNTLGEEEVIVELIEGDSPEIVGEQRFNTYARIGTEVRLPCTVIADPDPVFQWLRDEKILYNGTEGYTMFDTSDSSTLQFAFGNEEQLGEYICRANNALGEEEVIVELRKGDSPQIVGEQRFNKYARIDTKVQLPCTITAEPRPMFQWLRDEKILHSGTEGYTIFNTSNSSTLQFTFENAEQLGEYICRANNTLGEEEVIVVLKKGDSPEIVGEQILNTYARIGAEVRLPCTVTADPDPMFQWLHDEKILYNGTEGYTIIDTLDSSTLQFAFKSIEQVGKYICRASNALGQQEVIVELREGEPPQPPAVSVVNEDQGILKLNIEPKADTGKEEDLKTTGFRVQYMLASESWEMANTQDFEIGEPYLLKNLSFDSEYTIRAAGRNVAGYGEYSKEISYKTQTAPGVASASGIVASSLVLFTSIVFFRLF